MSSFPSKLLIILGIIILFFGFNLIWQRYSPKKLEFNNYSNSFGYTTAGAIPKQIIIPSLKLSLPIYPAQIHSKYWDATDKGVSYLVSSPIPGSKGNSIVYGHNWQSLLGSLPKIKPNDKIEVILDSGEKKIFKVQSTAIVGPDQTSILKDSTDARITIYTCTGFLDSQRFVAVATLL